MKRHHRLPKRLWMSLIELLVVITIIWILIWVLVPTIWNTQWRTRDITRQSQVQELATALMSYKLDYWEFPIIKTWLNEDTRIYRWTVNRLNEYLKEWWYITKIQKDPANLSFTHDLTEIWWETYNYTSNWYYIYLSNGKSFMIMTLMEDEKNWNFSVAKTDDLINKLYWITNLWDAYDYFFSWHSNTVTNWNIYIYKYVDEIL